MANIVQGEWDWTRGLPAEYGPQIQDLSRQTKMADILRQQAQEIPQGQMVSGHYVAPSITQYMANALKSYQANQMQKEADSKQAKLAEALKQKQEEEQHAIIDLQNGMGEDQLQNRSAMLSYLMKTKPELAANLVAKWGNDSVKQAADPYYSPIYDATRGAGFFNHRDGSYSFPEGVPIVKPSDSPQLQGAIAGAKAEKQAEWKPNTDVDGVVSTDANVARQVNGLPPGIGFGTPYPVTFGAPGTTATDAREGTMTEASVAVRNPRNGIRVPTKAEQKKMEADIGTQAAIDRLVGEDKAKSKIALPAYVAETENTIKLVDDLLSHPGMGSAVGLSSKFDPRNFIAGTDATDFNVMLDQLKGKQFLQAFEGLKGGGQITEMEGKKATDAIARMNTASSEQAFVRASREFQNIMRNALNRAKSKVGASQEVQAPQPQRNTVKFGDLK